MNSGSFRHSSTATFGHGACSLLSETQFMAQGSLSMLQFALFLFAIMAGYTASAITANLYRISGATADTDSGHVIRLAVMAIAGPSVFFERALCGYLAKEWTPTTFALVT